MLVRNRHRNLHFVPYNQGHRLATSYPTQVPNYQTSLATQNLNQQEKTSFPELVGRSSREAVAYLSARGLKPVLAKPNQAMTMDFRTDRVRIITD
ncbi:unnamed protein product, partial [Adineta steineri]